MDIHARSSSYADDVTLSRAPPRSLPPSSLTHTSRHNNYHFHPPIHHHPSQSQEDYESLPSPASSSYAFIHLLITALTTRD